MNRIRVFLVDSHVVTREGVRSLLASDGRFDIVGEAADGIEARNAVERLLPDIVITEASLPAMNGAELTRHLREFAPQVRTLVLTLHDEPGYVRGLIDCGASGYVLKRSPAAELLRAVEVVSSGRTYVDSAVIGHLQSQSDRGGPSAHSKLLSERERDVVWHVVHGYSNKEIAAKLGLSVKTVETYRSRATEKLGLYSRSDLVHYAVSQGWLSA